MEKEENLLHSSHRDVEKILSISGRAGGRGTEENRDNEEKKKESKLNTVSSYPLSFLMYFHKKRVQMDAHQRS